MTDRKHMPGEQPYSTAPKDGRPVNLLCAGWNSNEGGEWIGPLYWHPNHQCWANVDDHHLRTPADPIFWSPA